jgi:hypothetical protein
MELNKIQEYLIATQKEFDGDFAITLIISEKEAAVMKLERVVRQ